MVITGTLTLLLTGLMKFRKLCFVKCARCFAQKFKIKLLFLPFFQILSLDTFSALADSELLCILFSISE